jgi:copper(I)-binding protein
MFRREFLAAAAAFAAYAANPALADDVKLGNLTVSGAFARASPMMAQAGAGFMIITNAGEADKLIAAKSDISEVVELHTHIEENGMKAMRKVDFIDVPANGSVELKPGSYHVMFINLKERLQQGATVNVTLTFEKAGDVAVTLPVMGPGAMHGG